jgi:hypothetical protein
MQTWRPRSIEVRSGLAEEDRSMMTTTREATAVWIDDACAVIAQWDGTASVRELRSDVPAHRRSTGHVRHDPTVRHGGGGAPDDRTERDRAGHLRDFLEMVAISVPATGDVEVVGPGNVHEHFAQILAEVDRHRGRSRVIRTTTMGALTQRQLVAWLRERMGDPPRRRGIEPEA